MPRFTRSFREPRNTKDDRGKIAIRILLVGGKGNTHKKGNITRTLAIKDATVSEVQRLLERILFEEEGEQ